MKKIKLLLFTSLVFMLITKIGKAQTSFSMVSPDGKLSANIELKDKIYYSLNFEDENLIEASSISMELLDGTVWGKDPVARRHKSKSMDEVLTPLYGKEKK
jgi:alpha-glucosidase